MLKVKPLFLVAWKSVVWYIVYSAGLREAFVKGNIWKGV
jgi:hypothetical protein